MIPASIGNLFAGVVIMSMGFSFFFGSLKKGECCKKKKEEEEPAPEKPKEENMPNIEAVDKWKQGQQQLPQQQQQPNWVDAITGNNDGFARTVSC